jgi:hypothetical protein
MNLFWKNGSHSEIGILGCDTRPVSTMNNKVFFLFRYCLKFENDYLIKFEPMR